MKTRTRQQRPGTTPLPAVNLTHQNLLDRVIAYVAPGVATRRVAERNQLAISGAYTGARVDKAQLSRWTPIAGSANADTVHDLRMLRSRSRDQMRNAPVALGALNTTVSHTVGTGLTYTPAIDADFLGLDDEQAEEWQDDVIRRWKAWAECTDCDAARQLDFYGLQELGFRSFLESGDAFVLTPMLQRNGKGPKLALQLVEADRVCNPAYASDSATVISGMEILPETGETIAVHIARRHPGDDNLGRAANQWDRMVVRGSSTGRRNVLHIFKPLRPGQVRGVPWIAPIMEPLKQLGRWSEAELNAAVVSGLMATFVTMDPEAYDTLYDEDSQGMIIDKALKWSGEMESGKAVNLLPGESVESPAPGRPNPAFDPFWTAMVRQIGMALEMPFEVLVMHFESSYSAARAALLMAYKSFRSKRDMLTKTLCQPVFELWLTDEVASGRINAPGFFADDIVRAAWCAAIWTGDGPGSIDPEKEVNAAQKRVDLGISTKQAESIAFDGIDWQQKHEQRVKEINAEKADGIYFPPAGTPAASSPTAPPMEDGAPVPPDSRSATDAWRASLDARIDGLAKNPTSITVNLPPMEFKAGDVHIAQPGISIGGPTTTVNLPEGCIQLDATVEAPTLNIDVPAPQVTIQHAPQRPTRQVHTCDADGNLVETITTPLA